MMDIAMHARVVRFWWYISLLEYLECIWVLQVGVFSVR